MHGVCPEDVGVAGTCAGQGGNKPRARKGVPFEYRVGAPFCTICHYLQFNGKGKRENASVQILWGLSIGVGDFWCYDGNYLTSAS